MKCDVCESENNVKVRASGVGPVSFAYCERCLIEGYEPYSAIVSYYSMANMFYEDFKEDRKEFIDKNLKFHNKNKETFDEDIKRAIKDYNSSLKEAKNDWN